MPNGPGPQSTIANALRSATTVVDVSAATAPSAGQVLKAVDSTHATWQPDSGGSGTVTSVAASGGVETLMGSAITTSGTVRGVETVDARTTTTEAILDAARGKLVTFGNAGATTVSIAQAGAAGNFASGWYCDVKVVGAAAVTITPTTSTIDGAATLVLTQGQTARIHSDGTNYKTGLQGSLSGGGIGGSTGSTDNRILRADGTGGATLQNSAVTCDDSGNLTGVGTINSVKRYVALLTQSGTDAPVATVLENSLGGTVVWTRNDVGDYIATLAAAFPEAKTTFVIGNRMAGYDSFPTCVIAPFASANTLEIFTINADVAGGTAARSDSMLSDTPITVMVYP